MACTVVVESVCLFDVSGELSERGGEGAWMIEGREMGAGRQDFGAVRYGEGEQHGMSERSSSSYVKPLESVQLL